VTPTPQLRINSSFLYLYLIARPSPSSLQALAGRARVRVTSPGRHLMQTQPYCCCCCCCCATHDCTIRPFHAPSQQLHQNVAGRTYVFFTLVAKYLLRSPSRAVRALRRVPVLEVTEDTRDDAQLVACVVGARVQYLCYMEKSRTRRTVVARHLLGCRDPHGALLAVLVFRTLVCAERIGPVRRFTHDVQGLAFRVYGLQFVV
jgi:hypothetical protein